jgi:secondary thiamine-phosphate synthase enzyme
MELKEAPARSREVDARTVAPSLGVVQLQSRVLRGTGVAVCQTFLAETAGPSPKFYDVTDLVCDAVRDARIRGGQVVATTAHTTCALIVQENEPLLLADLAERLCRFASAEEPYLHNRFDIRVVNLDGPNERANGHSHCQHALLGASVALPIVDGQVLLGQWQRVLLVELDGPRTRQITVQITGVAD